MVNIVNVGRKCMALINIRQKLQLWKQNKKKLSVKVKAFCVTT